MKFLSLFTLSATIVLLSQPILAFDYTQNSSDEPLSNFPINITILEILGAITDINNTIVGNFSHYLIGFEIYLENYSITVENFSSTTPQLENYTYDPFGQRIKIMRNDSANTTIYTPFKELMRIVNSSGTYDFTYIYDGSTLVARVNPDGSKWYYHPDHLGSTTLITDQNGNVVEQTFYSPYGELLGGGTSDVKLYTSQFKDFSCEYYYGARYYNPCNAQFIQPDPLIKQIYNPQNLNRYSYTLNNPYRYTDPTGKFAVIITGGVSYAFGGLVSGESGFVINFDKDIGLQIASIQIGEGGVAVGGGGTVSVKVGIAPSIRNVKELSGPAATVGVSGAFIGGGGLEKTYFRGEGGTIKTIHSGIVSVGGEAQAYGLLSVTKITPLYESSKNQPTSLDKSSDTSQTQSGNDQPNRENTKSSKDKDLGRTISETISTIWRKLFSK